MESNIFKTALIIEGGGMRCSYTSGVVDEFLNNEIYFNYVTGISAGSSVAVNYLTRDRRRIKESFVDFVKDSHFAGWSYFFSGKGFFNSDYIYYQSAQKDGKYPFDFNAFMENPADLDIGAFNLEDNKLKYWSKKDMTRPLDVMSRVRASSTLPIVMPITTVDGQNYIDGGVYHGISLDAAKKRGYDSFIFIPSRLKGYRKSDYSRPWLIKKALRAYPQAVKTVLTRHIRYNKVLEEMENLEKSGKALILYPDYMDISNRELDSRVLENYFMQGKSKTRRMMPKIKEFLLKNEEEI